MIKVNLNKYYCLMSEISSTRFEAFIMQTYFVQRYEGGPKNNRKLNVARELEVVARCATRCHESIQYSSSLLCGINLG